MRRLASELVATMRDADRQPPHDPLLASFPPQLRRPLAGLALAASLAVLLLLGLLSPPRALARAHRSARRATHVASTRCGSAHARSKRHQAHACATSPSSGRPARRSAHRRPAAHVLSPAALQATPAAAPTAVSPPSSCANGEEPARVGDEVFECQDGSEPICEHGLSWALSKDGSKLVCVPALPTDQGSSEGQCEASSPTCDSVPGTGCEAGGGEGTPSCEDGSEASGEAEDPPSASAQRLGGPSMQLASGS
jgi:hypothetical protein